MKRYLLPCVVLFFVAFSCDDDEGSETPTDTISLDMIAEDLVSPVALVESPDNTDRLFVVDQPGQIYIIKNGERLSTPFLDIQEKIIPRSGAQDERGLLGLAFHPQFATNGRLFVFYSGNKQESTPSSWNHTNYVAEYTASGTSDQADEGSARIILAIDHPQSNHNAGMIAFGQDGFLYITTGDGGGGNDNQEGHVSDWYETNGGGNGQDVTENLLGSVLRIDVSTESGYGIPSDNPFVDNDGLDEIYAFGFRNPYRFCFDPAGKVILADAGQELFEEIDLVENGGNYGWNVKEGAHCFSTANPDVAPGSCPTEDNEGNPLIDPVIEFKNSKNASDGLGNVSIGGYVYGGDDISSLNGRYLFGVFTQDPDDVNGAIFSANRSGTTWSYEKLKISNNDDNELGVFLLGFGQDNDGEVYVLTADGSLNSGKVFKIENQ